MLTALIAITTILCLSNFLLLCKVNDLEKYINDSVIKRISFLEKKVYKLENDKIHIPIPSDEPIPDLIKNIEKEMFENN